MATHPHFQILPALLPHVHTSHGKDPWKVNGVDRYCQSFQFNKVCLVPQLSLCLFGLDYDRSSKALPAPLPLWVICHSSWGLSEVMSKTEGLGASINAWGAKTVGRLNIFGVEHGFRGMPIAHIGMQDQQRTSMVSIPKHHNNITAHGSTDEFRMELARQSQDTDCSCAWITEPSLEWLSFLSKIISEERIGGPGGGAACLHNWPHPSGPSPGQPLARVVVWEGPSHWTSQTHSSLSDAWIYWQKFV